MSSTSRGRRRWTLNERLRGRRWADIMSDDEFSLSILSMSKAKSKRLGSTSRETIPPAVATLLNRSSAEAPALHEDDGAKAKKKDEYPTPKQHQRLTFSSHLQTCEEQQEEREMEEGEIQEKKDEKKHQRLTPHVQPCEDQHEERENCPPPPPTMIRSVRNGRVAITTSSFPHPTSSIHPPTFSSPKKIELPEDPTSPPEPAGCSPNFIVLEEVEEENNPLEKNILLESKKSQSGETHPKEDRGTSTIVLEEVEEENNPLEKNILLESKKSQSAETHPKEDRGTSTIVLEEVEEENNENPLEKTIPLHLKEDRGTSTLSPHPVWPHRWTPPPFPHLPFAYPPYFPYLLPPPPFGCPSPVVSDGSPCLFPPPYHSLPHVCPVCPSCWSYPPYSPPLPQEGGATSTLCTEDLRFGFFSPPVAPSGEEDSSSPKVLHLSTAATSAEDALYRIKNRISAKSFDSKESDSPTLVQSSPVDSVSCWDILRMGIEQARENRTKCYHPQGVDHPSGAKTPKRIKTKRRFQPPPPPPLLPSSDLRTRNKETDFLLPTSPLRGRQEERPQAATDNTHVRRKRQSSKEVPLPEHEKRAGPMAKRNAATRIRRRSKNQKKSELLLPSNFASRHRQIEAVKLLPEYQKYVHLIPPHRRSEGDPSTPNSRELQTCYELFLDRIAVWKLQIRRTVAEKCQTKSPSSHQSNIQCGDDSTAAAQDVLAAFAKEIGEGFRC